MKKKFLLLLSFCILSLTGSAMDLKSSAFGNGELIPEKYTCDGENISPPLEWSGFPENTKSFALIVDDPDAPTGTVDHWIVYNLPQSVHSLEENIQDYPKNALGGQNHKGKTSYTGPCPPDKIHRYFFKIYALDNNLPLEGGATKQQVLDAMQKKNVHILDKAELMGQYDRKKRTQRTGKSSEQSH